MGKGAPYTFSTVVVDTQFTKVCVKPGTATGTIGAGVEVAMVTKLLITSRAGGLRESLKDSSCKFMSGTDLWSPALV